MNTGLTSQVKDAKSQMNAFDMPPSIPKEPPQITGKREPKVKPLVINGKPYVISPSVVINQFGCDASYIEIGLVGVGAMFVGLFIAGFLK